MDRAESSANRSRCPSLVAGSSIAGGDIGIGIRSGSGRRLLAKWMGVGAFAASRAGDRTAGPIKSF